VPGFLGRWLAAGLATAVLVALLYLPVARSSGLQAIVGNRFVQPLTWEVFLESLPGKLSTTWKDWVSGLPPGVGLLYTVGFLASLALHRRLTTHRAPVPLAALLWIGALLAAQRLTPWPRVWIFMLPLFLIWTAAGLVGLYGVAVSHLRFRHVEQVFLAGLIALIAGLAFSIERTQSPLLSTDVGRAPGAENVALFLKEQLEDGDVVVSILPSNYPLRYYFTIHNVPLDYFYRKKDGPHFDQAYVLVNAQIGQTVDQVLEQQGLAEVLSGAAIQEVYRAQSLVLFKINKSGG
jgi:hypothetical protein